MLPALLIVLLVTARAEVAPSDANCKEGAAFYQEPVSNIVGCYKVFRWASTWRSARDFCTDCSSGFCGTLAAARTQGEHDFLTGIAGYGIRFWIAANSLSNDKIWRWDGYSLGVNFNQPWVSLADLNYQAHADQVILAGRIAPYSWDFAYSNVSTYFFACRKDACAPRMDVLDGLCSTDAPSVNRVEPSSIAWIAAPIVLGSLFVLIVLTAVFLYYFHNDKFNTISRRVGSIFKSKPAASTSQRVAELKEENNRLRAQLRASLSGSLADGDSIGARQPSPKGSFGFPSPPIGAPLFTTASPPTLPTVSSLPRIRKAPALTSLPGLPATSLPELDDAVFGGTSNTLASSPLLPPISSITAVTTASAAAAPRPPSFRGMGSNRVAPAPITQPTSVSLPRPTPSFPSSPPESSA
eukprot:m.223231 g.223231  ORF g.223231 m.223231 type:complete len:411 (-) comp16208_c0_seq1:48-1280(-)